jgi:hypothetical protein
MWITVFISLANSHTANGNFNEQELLKSVGSGLDAKQTEGAMFNQLRLGFMILIHFKIDNLFYNILKSRCTTKKARLLAFNKYNYCSM